jgi:hypothetical protein
MAAKTAKQIAASRRNIAKAQVASAAARRGRHRSAASGHAYGTGKTGRRSTRRALYGSRRHGISPVQHQRRTQRANKWKRRVAGATAVGVYGAYATYALTTPQQRRSAANKVRDYGSKTKNTVKYAKSNHQFKKMMKANGIKVGKVGK